MLLQYFTFFRYSPRTASARPTKVEDFHSHCNETVSGWYHLATAPKGKGSHSWGCFVGRQVARAVPYDSPEYAPELIKARGGMESGEMVLSADVMIAQQAARFRAAGSAGAGAAGGRFADAGLDDADAAAVRAPVSHAALAAAEAAEGGRASVEDSLSALLRGDGEGAQAAAAALRAASHRSLAADADADAESDNGFITAFLETRAAASVSSDEAILGLASAEAASDVVRRINAGADAGARLWRAEVPTHLLGLSHEEARKRLGASASGKDVRAVSREAKAAARAAVHAAAAAGSDSGAAGSGHGHGHGAKHAAAHHATAAHGASSSRSRARINRRIAASEASNAALEHAHRMRLRARGSGAGDQHKHAVVDLSAKYGPHSAVTVDIAAFPKSLDWSTVAGGAYIPDVLDQGHCGSCYAASATDALTARARIKAAGKLNGFALSTQSVVQCSGHNQGCDGGYPYLVGKFGREIGFVPSECMHYTGRQDLCPARVDCPQASKYASLWAGLASPETTAFLEVASDVAAEVAAEVVAGGQGSAASGLRGSAAGAAAGEDALVAALQMQVQAEHAQSAASAETAGAGPLGFAFHPHQQAAVAGERQLPQFRQHHEAAEGEGLDEVAEQLAAGLMGADADAETELEATFGVSGSGSGDNKGKAAGKGKAGLGVVQGSLANTYALSDERLRVSRYEYVGGFYGAGSESAMIKELQKGPLVVALNAPGDLFYYSGGIYHHDEKPEVRRYSTDSIRAMSSS